MGKTAVIFASKYGATKRYAQWIAQALSCGLLEENSVKPQDLKDYDTIIYGGGLYAGGVNGISLLTKNFDMIRDKQLVLFTCGLSDPRDKKNTDHIRQSLDKVLTPEMREKIKIFHFRGGMDYAELSLLHRCMMAMLHKMTLKKNYETLRPEDKEMLETYGKKVDFTDQDAILPLIRYVKGESPDGEV